MPAKSGTPVSSGAKKTIVKLPRAVEKNLVAYAAAAGGALIGLGQPAAAEIVYTPSNIPVAQGFAGGAITQFDINNDGVSDFAFSNYSYFSHGFGAAYLKISPDETANQIVGVQIEGQKRVTAAALSAGVTVGPGANFQSSPNGLYQAAVFLGTSGVTGSGSWLTVETAYLGLKFVVNGEVHYGWARVKFVAPGDYGSASIYGYAYETIPDQAIVTGQTSGTAGSKRQSGETSAPRSGIVNSGAQSLGLLGLGAAGTKIWRNQPIATQPAGGAANQQMGDQS
jgi:hypothetical protein